ncbi:exocyst complex component EXO70H1-like [Tripterygium wilfordii]|nr:exocyst complex component EXO70H1-like [Tripterygium wilfordii]
MLLTDSPKVSTHSPRKEMPQFLSSNSLTSSYSFASPRTPSSPIHYAFSQSMMEENIDNEESIITKWDLNSSSFTKIISIFNHNRKEATEFLTRVKDLRQAMHFLVAQNSSSSKLVLAQTLMHTAMKRLEKEFYQILSANIDQLDPDSVSSRSTDRTSTIEDGDDFGSEEELKLAGEEELKLAGESITKVDRVSALAMSDLKSIADCMISSGYGKECVKIYKLLRKSTVQEGLYQLGVERYRSSHTHKMNWEALEHVSKHWMSTIKIAVKTLFTGERILSDHVFSASNPIRESCFSDITKEGARNLLRFPQLVAKQKKSPERIFLLMELYKVLFDLHPEIESIFSFESMSVIKIQALSSLQTLGESVCSILSDFESTIQKDSSKTRIAGGGIHPLTRKVMTYLSSLADYSGILSEIFTAHPPSRTTQLPESYFDSTAPIMSVHLARLILVLFCKLDCKAELYKEMSLSYLFLTNNHHFIVEQVRSSHLKDLLGDDWVSKHAKKVRQYALSYESMAWTKVFSTLTDTISPAMTPEVAKECFQRFNAAFEEAYRKQTSWIVPDRKLRDELKVSVAKKLVPVYREFYDAHSPMLSGQKNLELLVRFGPEDLGNFLSDLFHGTSSLGSSSSSRNSPRGCMPR